MWQEKGDTNTFPIEKVPVFRLRSAGIVLNFPGKNIIIDLSGTYSIKKRRVIRDNASEIIYKITIEGIISNSKFIGVEELDNKETKVDLIFPVIKTFNSLSSIRQKRMLINDRKNAIEFSVNSQGKIIG